MSITPLDIRKERFKKSALGFNREEVTTFLELVASELERLLKENDSLKQKIANLEVKNKEYQSLQQILQGTLLTAEKNAEEKTATAKKEAEITIREAELKGREVIDRCQKHAALILRQISDLKGHRENYILKFRSLLESVMRMLDETRFKEEEMALNGTSIPTQLKVEFPEDKPKEAADAEPEISGTSQAESLEE